MEKFTFRKPGPSSSNGAVLLCSVRGLLCALAVIACVSQQPAVAQMPLNTTAGEIALLPEYCRDTQTFGYGNAFDNPSPRSPHWVALMGKDFWAMHHYCWGLINLRRVKRMPVNSAEYSGTLIRIVADYMYVINSAGPDFVMLPEIYARLGEAKILQNDIGGALEAYAKARAIKPDYWPAYSQWAEFLIKHGMRSDAKSILASGLQHAPNALALVELYRSLGEDPSKVPPLRSAAAGRPGIAQPQPTASTRQP